MELIFQRWISWFPQRWRTPRNAIRNANCRIKWVIKSLNANCCSDYFSWSIPGSDSVNHHNRLRHAWLEGWGVWRFMRLQIEHSVCRSSPTDQGIVLRWVELFSTCQSKKSFGAELRWEDPPNLNILLSGGKETNKDSLSNGEWSGTSSIF